MKHLIPLIMLLSCAALASQGCVGTDIGNPEQDTEVTVEMEGHEPEEASGGLVLDNGVTLDELWIVVEAVSLQSNPDGTCSAPPSADADGPFVVELLGSRESPAAPTFTRPTDTYCGLQLRFTNATEDILPADAPSALLGNAIYATGSRLDSVPFTLLTPLQSTLELSGSFELQPERDRLILAFDLSGVLSANALSGILDILLGAITIDPDTNADILGDFVTALLGSASLYRDDNDSGRLDAAEIGTPLATSRP